MAQIVIKGAKPYDGEYDLDLDRAWTIREWNWIKVISGYMPATIDGGLKGNDPMLYVALAVIAMARNGKVDRDDYVGAADRLQDADRAAITLEIDQEGDDAGPPELTKDPDAPSANGTPSASDSSGDPSSRSSDLSDASPAPTGIIESDTSDTLAPTTLAKPHRVI